MRRALVTQDIFDHRDDAERLRKKIQQDLREEIKKDLLNSDEIKNMKGHLKQELLEELRSKNGVC